MSAKAGFLRVAVRLTPAPVMIFAANIILRGIAKIYQLSVDLDTRRVYVKLRLNGESDFLEVLVEDFYIISQAGTYQFTLCSARSNKSWMANILARMVGKPIDMPVIPKYAGYMATVAELLAPVK
jgi:hypothetical protein